MATLHDNDNTLLALVRTTFDAHSAVLFLPDQSGNYTVALSSTDNEPSVQEVTIAPGKGLVGWILRHKQPVIVNNLDMRHTFLGYYDENDEGAISAFMGCHIPEGGALCVDVRPRAYTEEDQLLLHRLPGTSPGKSIPPGWLATPKTCAAISPGWSSFPSSVRRTRIGVITSGPSSA
ncbi:MAG: GAF domain-containing protein [Bilophila wadsworthia]